jgi:hypothetical protein
VYLRTGTKVILLINYLNFCTMKDLELMGVQEMDSEQLKVNGGWLAGFLAVAGAAIYVYNNWDDFADGFHDGYNR